MAYPTNLVYTKQHLWVNTSDGSVGITDYAANELGDILFVELPEEGAAFEAGEKFTELESSKTTVELNLPFAGEVKEANEALDDEPESINENAYEAWIAKFDMKGKASDTMTAEEYEAFLGTL